MQIDDPVDNTHPGLYGFGNYTTRNWSNMIRIRHYIITPALQGPILCSALFSAQPYNQADRNIYEDNFNKYIILPCVSILSHSLFAAGNFNRVGQNDWLIDDAMNIDLIRPGGINLFLDTTNYHKKQDDGTIGNYARFKNLTHAHSVMWPLIRGANFTSSDAMSGDVLNSGFDILRSYVLYNNYLDGINDRCIQAAGFFDTLNRVNISPYDYMVFLIQRIYNHYGTNENPNYRLFKYNRVDLFTQYPVIGQYIRYFVWFQTPFRLYERQYYPIRQMIFRDAHATTPSPRSADKDRHFFELCEFSRRRKCMLGTSSRYDNPQHINMSLANTYISGLGFTTSAKSLGRNIPGRLDLVDPKNRTSTRQWKNANGILAGVVEAFNPSHESQAFISWELFFEPINYSTRDRAFNGVQLQRDNYYGYGIDEYILTRFVRHQVDTRGARDEVDIYFWDIMWMQECWTDWGSDLSPGMMRQHNQISSEIGNTIQNYTQYIVAMNRNGPLLSSYSTIEFLYANANSILYRGALLNNTMPRQMILNTSLGLGNPEIVYFIGRFDRIDTFNLNIPPNVQYTYINATNRVVGVAGVYNALTCTVSVPPPPYMTNRPRGQVISVDNWNASFPDGCWPMDLPKPILRSLLPSGGVSIRGRRLPSLPTRRAPRFSSSKKKRYTHRRRALRTGKGGYRPIKTGRKV